jgi:hypothetical protein
MWALEPSPLLPGEPLIVAVNVTFPQFKGVKVYRLQSNITEFRIRAVSDAPRWIE